MKTIPMWAGPVKGQGATAVSSFDIGPAPTTLTAWMANQYGSPGTRPETVAKVTIEPVAPQLYGPPGVGDWQTRQSVIASLPSSGCGCQRSNTSPDDRRQSAETRNDGSGVGAGVGVGTGVGVGVGTGVGGAVGPGVGGELGWPLGPGVGAPLGLGVGLGVGPTPTGAVPSGVGWLLGSPLAGATLPSAEGPAESDGAAVRLASLSVDADPGDASEPSAR